LGVEAGYKIRAQQKDNNASQWRGRNNFTTVILKAQMAIALFY